MGSSLAVGKEPEYIEVEGLADLQSAVGGYIESCGWVFGDEPCVYVNDEGKFACKPNRAVYATEADAGSVAFDGETVKRGDVLDILFGDFVCIGFDAETGEDRDITEEEAAKVFDRFGSKWSIESGWAEALRIRARMLFRDETPR